MNRLKRLGLASSILTIAMWAGGSNAATSGDAPTKLHISTLGPGPASCPLVPPGQAFVKGLGELGYDSHNLATEYWCYSELADLPRLVAELLNTQPALVAVWGSVVAVRAVQQAAPTLPIVVVDVTDPVETGLVASLAHPGGNITGNSNVSSDLQAKRVQILRDALPHATRLGVLCNLANPLQEGYLRVTQAAARTMSFEAHTYSVQTPGELEGAFAAMSADHMDALILQPDAWFYPNREQIVALAARYRIPAIYTNTEYPKLGALFTYAVDLVDMSYRAAKFVDKILKGAKPADMPVELPTKYVFIINAKTAHDLGLSIPPAVMHRATQVIE